MDSEKLQKIQRAAKGEIKKLNELKELECKRIALAESQMEAQKIILELAEQLTSTRELLDFYKKRVELLQQWQSKMRDPERTIACDIIANGQTLPPEHAGDRYLVAKGGVEEKNEDQPLERQDLNPSPRGRKMGERR